MFGLFDLREGSLNREGGTLGVSLGEEEQGQSGLRVSTEFVGALKCFVRRRQIPHAEPDLTHFVMSPAHRIQETEVLQLFAGRLGLLFGLQPISRGRP